MKAEQFILALGNVQENYILEAEPVGNPKMPAVRQPAKTLGCMFRRFVIAAVLALCLLVEGIILLSPKTSAVTAYAYGDDQEINSSGFTFTTGFIDQSGELTGHPMMFHLSGEKIKTVRFSCKNEQINFMDLTEKRDEYGAAQNFTVPYGENESEYSFLVIDWVPSRLISALQSGAYDSVAALPSDLRQDIIVMEITLLSSKTVTKAITITLNDDGTIFAAFCDYRITPQDEFVKRTDSPAIARNRFYKQGDITVAFYDQNGCEIESDALWYNTYSVDHIAVRWNGRFAESVQMFCTPAGSETLEEMELLATKVNANAENTVVFSADCLHRENLMGHLDFLIDLGQGCCIRSELYNVLYDPTLP